MTNDDQTTHPVLRVASVGGALLAGMTWGERASMLAAGYTALLIFEWFYRRFIKPYLIRTGRMKGKPRPFMDTTGRGDL